MSVARKEQSALVEDWQIECSAGAKFLVVHIATERAGHRRPASPPAGRRSGGDDAEERIERNLRSPRHDADIAFTIDYWMDGLVVGELVR